MTAWIRTDRFADAVELELGVELEVACIEAALRSAAKLAATYGSASMPRRACW